jgi:hypothetical protein
MKRFLSILLVALGILIVLAVVLYVGVLIGVRLPTARDVALKNLRQLEEAFLGSTQVSPPVLLPLRLESYFEQYCDYTGGMGIGFDARDTYDYRFRQHLKQNQDPEAKRLFVLQHLHQDVDGSLRRFEDGIVMTGKTSSRPLTLSEWQATRQEILRQLEDLATYAAFTNYWTGSQDLFDHPDPALEMHWIDELRQKMGTLTNAPVSVR